jgi:hypothetical protein
MVTAAAGRSLRSGQYVPRSRHGCGGRGEVTWGDRACIVEGARRAGSDGSCRSCSGPGNPARRSWRQGWLLLRRVGRRRRELLDGIARSVAARELSAPIAAWLIRFWRVGSPKKLRAHALRVSLGLTFGAPGRLMREASDKHLICDLGHLFRRSRRTSGERARGQATGLHLGDRLAIRLDTSELACRT